MLILSIESTCDETCAALVEDGRIVHVNVTYSQIAEHNKTGGVVPEVAARRHAEAITQVLEEALKQYGEKIGVLKNVKGNENDGNEEIGKESMKKIMEGIDAIAVAQGPGLLGCLMVGNNAASALSLMWEKPLIPVHHIEGHLYASWLREKDDERAGGDGDGDGDDGGDGDNREVEFPMLILTVSGGHNQLFLMEGHGKYKLLGETLDDAAGEAFDKVARMLGLGYPGGPEIQRIAANGNEANGFKPGDPFKYELPRAMMKNEHADEFNFSFSGLKTAMRTLILNLKVKGSNEFDQALPDVAASFEYTVCDTLLKKLRKAAELHGPKEIHIAGGVSANLRLRKMLEHTFASKGPKSDKGKPREIEIHYPALKFCTDNAAMLGSVAYFRYIADPEKYSTWENSVPNVGLKFH